MEKGTWGDFILFIFEYWYLILAGLALMWISLKITTAITPAVDDGMGGKVKRVRTRDAGCVLYKLGGIIATILLWLGLID